jgi:transcriptional regulator with XRE-family HTH domain/tetratricopeptide (TPR) repeat protein
MTIEPELSFGHLLRHRRQSAGLSQEELAERAGLTAGAIGALERGERRRPYPHSLQVLADALELTGAERTTFFMSVPRREARRNGGTVARAPTSSPRWSSPPMPLTLLVGRERQQALLRSLQDEARGGQTQVALIAGEPGIGKTRLAEELSIEASNAGFRAFWGHCYEWEGAPAYWPWVQILRDYAEGCAPDLLQVQLGPGAPLVAGIVPEFAGILPDSTTLRGENPTQARFELFDSIARFLRRATHHGPLLLVLDDLHWADPPSLMLLEFIVREVADAPLLIVGTYRDVEVRRRHPLAATLAALSRARSTQRLGLIGLGRNEVYQIVQQLSVSAPSEWLIDAVYARTEGNPFFVTELARLLADQATDDEMDERSIIHQAIPEGVREAIGQRLDTLSKPCNQLLSVASVIGRDFDLHLLETVSEWAADAMLDVLDEAVQAGVITEQRSFDRYGFSHALIHETIYDRLTTSSRMRLHCRVGNALEDLHASNLAPVYGDLARHFFSARIVANLNKAITYATKAGEQAMRQLAWESAVGHFQRAVEIVEAHPDIDPAHLCEALLALGDAQDRAGAARGQFTGAGSTPLSRETFRRAVIVAREAELAEHLARSALGFAGRNVGGDHGGPEGLEFLREAVERLPEDDSVLKARVLMRLGAGCWLQRVFSPDDPDIVSETQVRAWADAAVKMARRLGEPVTLGYALFLLPETYAGPPEEIDSYLAVGDEIDELAVHGDDEELAAWALGWKFCLLWQRGDIVMARRVRDAWNRTMRQLQTPYADWSEAIGRAGEALALGRYASAEQAIEQAHAVWPNTWTATFQQFTLSRELQQPIPDNVVEFLRSRYRMAPSAPQSLAFWLSYLVETQQIREARAVLTGADLQALIDGPRTTTWIRAMSLLAEVTAKLADSERAAVVHDALCPYARHNLTQSYGDSWTGGAVSYYVGLAASASARWNDADRHFRDALVLNEQWGFRPYAAYTHYAWADTLARRGRLDDRARARESLRYAKSVGEELGMLRLLRLIMALEEHVC